MHPRSYLKLSLFFFIMALFPLTTLGAFEAPPTPEEKRIDELIKQLGNEDFDLREKAGEQLLQISTAAPALRRAVHSRDTEIARRAAELLPRLRVSRRTLATWRSRGVIPFIRLPGSRRILFDWNSVRAALLRQQKGQP